MKKIGDKLKEIRKTKGLSQEELADSSNVNLRTIQRIENNESEPRGKTLNQICLVLNLNIEDLLDHGKEDDNNYLVLFHLSVMSALFIPLGNLILPYIMWSNKKDKIIGLNAIGINLINFQIVLTAITTITMITSAAIKILHISKAHYSLTIGIILYYFLNLVLPLIFSIRMRNNKKELLYPKLIKIIK
ncbi:helix-turn-helix domain-containing protein [bacterium]|nr:helix-turn-helix domain-containing protein [bacterium]